MHLLPFPTRTDAGMQLAKELSKFKNAKDSLILALVRGGVVIGKALIDELNLPLHPYIVRKLGHPGHREYALGAIAEGGSTFLDDAMMRVHDLDWKSLEPIIEEEMKELKRRKEKYMVKPRPDLKDKTVILTDDGAATGATLFAAIEDLRKAKVQKIIVALPVCPPDTANALRKKADETFFVATPATFYAVGQFYVDFEQVEDEEVITILNNTT
ncbi:phosphoribosyltransferase [Patescibacteria group bacterium]|nr:phosphoribosyltransferase [Patescibacteria group bacterium]MBU2259163.1 phosphoribosyltransferase [Patescibacteria group bacterium]